MIRIAIAGSESTGKSTLVEQLAKHYKCDYAKEVAREYIDNLAKEPTYINVLEIAELQIKEEERIKSLNQAITFFDTELITIKIWLQFVYNEYPSWIDEHIKKNKFDLYLLMDIDIPWVADEQRANPNDRKELFNLFKQELDAINANYKVISGTDEVRFENAIKAIGENL